MRQPLRLHAAMIAALIGILLFAPTYPARAATIFASGDNSKPFTSTNHSITGPSGNMGPPGASVTIAEDVAISAAAGPWRANLINNATDPASMPPNSILSGIPVSIVETLSNLGGIAWDRWNGRVLTRTTISSPNDAPGFQFRNNSFTIEADYGSGFVLLASPANYAITGTPAPGPGFDPNGWESYILNLQPGFEISPGNKLRITKSIFEVFGDGNVWVQGEAAQIAQFPSNTGIPEPATPVLLLPAAALAALRRASASSRKSRSSSPARR